MDIAKRSAEMSYAKRLKVGAIVVKDDNILAQSWNGTPNGWSNECEYKLDDGTLKTKPEVIHAESNALTKLAKSTSSSNGATLFCTHSPCQECAKLIYQAGISEVYYETDFRDSTGIDFLKRCGINVIKT